MKKRLFTLIVLVGLAILGLKGAAMLMTHQAVDTLRSQHSEQLALSYGWVSARLNGEVELRDVSFKLFKLKRNFKIATVVLQFDSLPDMLQGLYEFRTGDVQRLRRLVLHSIESGLQGRDPEQWLAQEVHPVFAVPLALYGCGDFSRVNAAVLQKMGIQSLSGTLDLLIQSPGHYEVDLDTEQIGRWQASLLIQEGAPLQLLDPASWVLRRFDLSYIESGYFRRLSNFCANLTQQDREAFARTAARQWRLALARSGFLLGGELEQTYARFLALGGQLNLSLVPGQETALSPLMQAGGQNLGQTLGLQVNLNGEAITQPQLFLQASIVEKPTAKPSVSQKAAQKKAAAPVEQVKQWLPVAPSFEVLSEQLGFPLRIETLEGKQVEGRLTAVDAQRLTIAQRVGSGEISFSILLDEIAGVAVYR